MHTPEEDLLYEKTFAAFNREKFTSDKEGFRELYFDLCKRIEAALWLEQIIRSKVLMHDLPSVDLRLNGAQLAEHCRARSALAVNSIGSGDLGASIDRVLSNQFFDCYYVGWPFQPSESYVRDYVGTSQPPIATGFASKIDAEQKPCHWELQPFDFLSAQDSYKESKLNSDYDVN